MSLAAAAAGFPFFPFPSLIFPPLADLTLEFSPDALHHLIVQVLLARWYWYYRYECATIPFIGRVLCRSATVTLTVLASVTDRIPFIRTSLARSACTFAFGSRILCILHILRSNTLSL